MYNSIVVVVKRGVYYREVNLRATNSQVTAGQLTLWRANLCVYVRVVVVVLLPPAAIILQIFTRRSASLAGVNVVAAVAAAAL